MEPEGRRPRRRHLRRRLPIRTRGSTRRSARPPSQQGHRQQAQRNRRHHAARRRASTSKANRSRSQTAWSHKTSRSVLRLL